jgi:periplasmic nitrate reductase NapD
MPASRRAFIRGQWNAEHPDQLSASPPTTEIVSLIVSTWPQYLKEVAQAIEALGNCEIHNRAPSGKLIVVIEGDSQGAVGAKANAISDLPHVLSATMVFQASDQDETMA